jgi:hypothetical protein
VSGAIPVLHQFLLGNNQPMRHAKRFPLDMYDHLFAILRKWQGGDFSVRPHRGFRRNTDGRWARDPNRPHVRNGRFFGHGHLINGQRFVDRRQLCLVGGHAATQAGIAGTEKLGAYSIVMGLHCAKGQVYADVDCGNKIYYMSTALPAEEGEIQSNHIDLADQNLYVDPSNATRGAKALLKSHKTKKPVRLFRSR